MRFASRFFLVSLLVLLPGVWLAAQEGKPVPATVEGAVKIDGSSTVFPITEAVAEEFQKVNSKVSVPVARSGTGGGFKKFVVGDIDISNASRPIMKDEAAKAAAAGISYIEIPVAYDGIVIVVNPKNTFVKELTIEDLKKIWRPENPAMKWNEVRAEWPDQPLRLYGAGADSGTFDYFTEAVNGKSKSCRKDYQASEDDNTLVIGVAGDKNALGFFGYSYFAENQDKLRAIPIHNGKEAVAPTVESIETGTYKPLSRPVFIYVNKVSAERGEVKAFVNYFLQHATTLVPDTGMVPLSKECYDAALKRFEKGKTGSMFGEGDSSKESILERMKKHE